MFKSIFVCGDSFPYGYELEESKRTQVNFPALIGKHFNVPVHNHSLPGGGNDRILRICFTELPKLAKEKPFVVIPWSQPHRKETWDCFSKSYKPMHPPPGTDNEYTRLYFEQYSCSADEVLKTLVAKISVQHLLEKLKLNYLYIEMFDDLPKVPKQYEHLLDLLDPYNFLPGYLGKQYQGCDMAPGGHPLEEGHQKMANYLITEIVKRER